VASDPNYTLECDEPLWAARLDHGLDTLQVLARDWSFFDALLSNAEMALAKADLGIARRYVDLWDQVESRERIWGAIAEEFALTVTELLRRLRAGEGEPDEQLARVSHLTINGIAGGLRNTG
jgi:phosphoenolpyruvate carboxylase